MKMCDEELASHVNSLPYKQKDLSVDPQNLC